MELSDGIQDDREETPSGSEYDTLPGQRLRKWNDDLRSSIDLDLLDLVSPLNH